VVQVPGLAVIAAHHGSIPELRIPLGRVDVPLPHHVVITKSRPALGPGTGMPAPVVRASSLWTRFGRHRSRSRCRVPPGLGKLTKRAVVAEQNLRMMR